MTSIEFLVLLLVHRLSFEYYSNDIFAYIIRFFASQWLCWIALYDWVVFRLRGKGLNFKRLKVCSCFFGFSWPVKYSWCIPPNVIIHFCFHFSLESLSNYSYLEIHRIAEFTCGVASVFKVQLAVYCLSSFIISLIISKAAFLSVSVGLLRIHLL